MCGSTAFPLRRPASERVAYGFASVGRRCACGSRCAIGSVSIGAPLPRRPSNSSHVPHLRPQRSQAKHSVSEAVVINIEMEPTNQFGHRLTYSADIAAG